MQANVLILIVFCTISSSLAAVGMGPATVHDSHPNMCFESGKQIYYNPGQSWQLEGCAIATCFMSNYSGVPQLIVSYESCGSVGADPPCYTTEDTTLAYPDCCPEIVCPETNTSEPLSEGQGSNEGSKELTSTSEGQARDGRNDKSEKDSENEIEDTIKILSDPKLYGFFDLDVALTRKNSKGSSSSSGTLGNDIIESNDLSHLGTSDLFENSDDYDIMSTDRRISPRFFYQESISPGQGSFYEWTY